MGRSASPSAERPTFPAAFPETHVTPPSATHIWLNGRLLPSDEPHLSVYDRGFQLGDGVFEALRARRGVPIELEGHLSRLHGSLAAMAFELPFGDEVLVAGITELLAAEGWDGVEPMTAAVGDGSEASASAGGTPGDAVIRITVSRGYDPTRGVAPREGSVASAVIQAWPFARPSARALDEGERFITSAIRRAPDSPVSGIKTTSRVELVYARIEAERAGADDAIFLTTDGRLTEATTSNVLVIRGDECATPRLGTGLLAGTTRAWLVEHGDAVGLRMVQRDIPLEEALAADELAVCASIGGVIPVTVLNGRPIGNGRPGPRTVAMRHAREAWIDRVSTEGARARLAATGGATR
jgi:branched-chain amino acid aminotransferase